jgi:L-alanine-DL-glutamate epimerase-like enolase superfamily enzyme
VGGAAVVAAEAVRVRVPFRRPIRTAAGIWTHRESWIVRVWDAAGAVGLGEAALDYDAATGVAAELAGLVGRTIEGIRGGGRLPSAAELEAAGVAGRALRCALDSARMERGAPHPVAVNATIGYLDLRELEAAARRAVAAGFGTIKMKVGPERGTAELVERVAGLRAATGPDVRLRLDANGAWDVATARERIAAVAPFGIEYVEQPVAAGDPRDLAVVRAAGPVPIAADESVSSVAAARELLALRAAAVLVVKPARVGGPVAAREIAALAAAEGVAVVISTLFETGVGLAAALAVAAGLPVVGSTSLAHGLATADLLESDLLTSPLPVVGGRMAVPVEISLDEDAVGRYAAETVGGRP